MLKISTRSAAAIIAQAEREAPLEACGYLAGKDGKVLKHYEMTNIDASSDHFTLDPKEQFDVVRKARKENMDILAVYHSHPESPARPSAEDIKLAADPDIIYVIVSLKDEEKNIKAFIIKDAKADEVEVEVIDDRL